jgi:hypothetical protein
MNPSAFFRLQAFVIVALPVVLLRVTGFRDVMPLVVVQSFVGVGPSVFNRLAPSYFKMFAGPSTLAPLLIFGLHAALAPSPAPIESFGHWPRQMSLSSQSNGRFRAPWPLAQSS